MQTFPATEGFIPFHGYHTWYRIVGNDEEPGKLPLLVLHGGPGASYDYLEPLEAMARTGRRVIVEGQMTMKTKVLTSASAYKSFPVVVTPTEVSPLLWRSKNLG